MNIAAKQLTGSDLQELAALAQSQMEEAPEFWEAIQRFSVLERLNRKTYNTNALDLSTIEGKEVLEDALMLSLACEQAYNNHDRDRLAKFFRYITGEIEGLIYEIC